MVQFSSQLEAMQHLKEQLEQRTRMIEANIQRQQDELRQIQDELQRVQGQSLQVRLRSCSGVCGKCMNTQPNKYVTALAPFIVFFIHFLDVLLLMLQRES